MNENLLNKKINSAIHGIAILMMIYHHTFINGNTWCINFGKSIFDILNNVPFIGGNSAQLNFAWFCRMCVGIFAFTSGHALYIQLENNTENLNILQMYKYILKRFLSFYKKYFLAFVVFISCEYFMGNQNGFDFSIQNTLLNLSGITSTFNSTWWYVSEYYILLLAAPIIFIILKKIKTETYILIALLFALSIIVAFITGNLLPFLKLLSYYLQRYQIIYLLIFMEGMFTVRYNLINIIGNKINSIISIIVLLMIYVARVILIRTPSDCLFDLVLITPFIICLSKLLSKSKYLIKGLMFLGKYSSYMWYSHAYFYAYLFFHLTQKSDYSVLVYLQVVIYSLIVSIVFTFIEENVYKLIIKMKTSKN